jgi:uncharacterized protein YtpQ (UPF0354 family)
MTRAIAALILALCVGAAQAKTLTPGEFTAAFTAVLRAELPTATIVAKGDLELVIKDADGKKTATAFLHNAYQEYTSAPSNDVQNVIRKYVTALVEQQQSKPAKLDRARIVPVIKDRQWLADTQQTLKARGAGPLPAYIFEPLNDELLVFYAEDTPNNIRYLTPKSLEEAGVAQADLRALSIANLKKLLPKIELRSGPLVSMVVAGGNYEASLLLLDDVWSKGPVPAKVDGDVVVAIPARDLLMVTGSRNRAGVERLRQLATKLVHDASYRLTPVLFVYRNGRFTRFDGS